MSNHRTMNFNKKTFLILFSSFFLLPSLAMAVDTSIIPSDRSTIWNPGLNSIGGIPNRTTICTNIDASTYGNGTIDATAAIQAALTACPVGQVVKLSAGDFMITNAVHIRKGIVLRGEGPTQTKLKMPIGTNSEVIVLGMRWFKFTQPTDLATNAVKGSYSVTLASNPGLNVGEIVLVDQLTNPEITKWSTRSPVGNASRGWFNRLDRPLGQMMEIASIDGNTVTFTTPFHINFDTAFSAQLARVSQNGGSSPVVPAVKYAGLEDLYVSGGGNNNISLEFASYSWVKNVESDSHGGKSVSLAGTFRSVVRDSFIHSTRYPNPGGGGYGIALNFGSADNLIENNIVWNMNKVMVMQATGGGNVIGYNYMEDGWIAGTFKVWVEVGLNASHMTTPHMELFEGNQSFNFDADNTWGNAVNITVFRNHLTGRRRSASPLELEEVQNRRSIGLMEGHWWYTFIGNVLGTENQNPAPHSSFVYESTYPWPHNPVGMWKLGYNPDNWSATADPKVLSTIIRDGNFDYFTNTVNWQRSAQAIPNSLYLDSKPSFFGSNPWPWVDATGSTKVGVLPARERFDAIKGTQVYIPAITDTTAPTVSISAPVNGSIVSGNSVTISANASDNISVVGVQFRIDGVNVGTEDTTYPYSISWNTTTAANGSRLVSAVARDAAGNTTTSTGVIADVSNFSTGSLSVVSPLTRVRYYPRTGQNARMVNGKIQGSNTSRTSGFVDLATITVAPPSGAWSTINITNPTAFKYYRYISVPSGKGNVSELEFYNGDLRLSGISYGSLGSYNGSGYDYSKALDGNVATYFDTTDDNGVYVGIELSDPAPVVNNPTPENPNTPTTPTIPTTGGGGGGIVTPPSANPTDTIPKAPTSLSATIVAATQINVTWSDLADNESGYRIERKTANGTYAEIATVSADTRSYSNTGVASGEKYAYRVRAYNSTGQSTYSNEAIALTEAAAAASNTGSNTGTNTTTPGQTTPTTPAQGNAQTGGGGGAVSVGNVVKTTAKLNVRTTPGGKVLGVQVVGASGKIIEGPTLIGGNMWYKVNYDKGVDGWSAAPYVAGVSSSATPTTPTTVATTTLSSAKEAEIRKAIADILALIVKLQEQLAKMQR